MDSEYKLSFKKVWGHFCTINKHRWLVFKFACKAGIPWRGLIHDLSKYSPTEFWDSARYYQGGRRSPIPIEKQDVGFSKVWLHHKGRNKHHFEYWYDEMAPIKAPILPYKYTIEMVCDKLSASITYLGDNWTNESELTYWKEKEANTIFVNPQMRKFFDEVFEGVAKEGIDKIITPKNLRTIYDKYCK